MSPKFASTTSSDIDKTREQLLSELQELRAQVAILKEADVNSKSTAEAFRESEEKYRDLVENVNDIVWQIDEKFVFTYISPQIFNAWGYTPEEVVGKALMDFMQQDEASRVSGILREIVARRSKLLMLENKHVHKGGNIVYMEVSGTPIFDEHGDYKGYRGIARDITGRKQAEDALRESEKRLAADLAAVTCLRDVSARFVQEGDLHTLLEDVMDAAIAIAGADMGTLQLIKPGSDGLEIVAHRGFEQPYLDFFSSVSHGSAAVCGTALQQRERVIVEDVAKSPIFIGKPAMDVQMAAGVRAVQSTPLVNRRGEVIGILSTHWRTPHRPDESVLRYIDLLARQATDIIERKRAEEAVMESEEKYRRIVEMENEGIWMIDQDDVTTFVNPGMTQMLGYSKEEIVGRMPYDFVDYIYREETRNHLNNRHKGVREQYICKFLRKDGSDLWTIVSANPLYDYNGTYAGAMAMLTDITERRRVEEALRESEERYRSLFEHMINGFAHCKMLYDEQGHPVDFVYLTVNDAFGRLTGLENVVGKRATELFQAVGELYPELFEIYGRVALAGQPEQFEIEFKPLSSWLSIAVYSTERGYFTAIFENITERKHAEEALRESEERLALSMKASQSGTFDWDAKMDVNIWSDELLALYGLKREEFAGTFEGWLGCLVPEDREKGKAAVLRSLDTGFFELEFRIRRHDTGELRWMYGRGQAFYDRDDRPERMIGTNVDITERKRAEEALWENEERFRALVTASSELLYRMSPDWGEMRQLHSRGFLASTEMPNRNWLQEYIPPEDQPRVTAAIAEAIRTRGVFELEHRVWRADGTTGWTFSRAVPILDTKGEITEWFGAANDITERKRAEEALIREKSILTKSQEVAHVGNWAYDPQTGIFTGSTENDRIYGYEPGREKATREWVLSRVLPEDRTVVYDFMDARLRDGDGGSIDYRIRKPDGSVVYVNTIVDKAARDGSGRIKKIYGISQDITERKRAEEELMAAKQQAELYLDLMGHDINNMHQVALGYLELARDMLDGGEQAGFLDKPMEVLQRSAQLISNVRKLQKLHDGIFQIQDIDVCKLLADVRNEYGAVPGKTVELNLNGHVHCFVRADELLYDVFANLVNNAVKHTGHGTNIIVDLDVLDDNGRRYCRVSVEDNGPGIPDDSKERIFNRMHKGSARGMGLGLYLVKTLVDSYGGRVWVEDRIQGDYTQGARFVVMLPAVEK